MTPKDGEAALRILTKRSFLTRRVIERLSRGEISVATAIHLLEPEAERLVRIWRAMRDPERRPVTFEVTLQIDPRRVAKDATVGIVGLRLVNMGGSFVHWQPGMNRQPAIARFQFSTADERDQFVAEAVAIPGVALETLGPADLTA